MELELVNLDSLIFTKPKKHGDFLVCKIKYPESEGFKLQFPKMKIVSESPNKFIELEFIYIKIFFIFKKNRIDFFRTT